MKQKTQAIGIAAKTREGRVTAPAWMLGNKFVTTNGRQLRQTRALRHTIALFIGPFKYWLNPSIDIDR